MKRISIAIDGPAASGKSTTARLVARTLGYLHLDTGAMYRAITLGVLKQGIAVENQNGVREFAEKAEVTIDARGAAGNGVLLNGSDVTDAIRSPEVTKNVSAVSSYEGVRRVMVREQRKMARRGGVVLEGRDIGTVVLPDAELKIYMIADVHERARRRQRDLMAAGVRADETEIVRDIEDRDRKDSTREVSPLRKADGAIILDTSTLTIDQQVSFIVERARAIIERRGV